MRNKYGIDSVKVKKEFFTLRRDDQKLNLTELNEDYKDHMARIE